MPKRTVIITISIVGILLLVGATGYVIFLQILGSIGQESRVFNSQEESETDANSPSAKQTNQQKVDHGVQEAFKTNQQIFVVVAFITPSSPLDDLAALKQEIAVMQSSVLTSVTRYEFRPVHQYEAVPGMTGWITEAGLEKLIVHPFVAKIGLDVGGGGGNTTVCGNGVCEEGELD